MSTITLGAFKPEDSIAAFQQRGLLRPSFRWQDVWQAEHARAFAVAGVMRLDILRTIREQVDLAVSQGRGFGEFHAALKRQLVAKGWWGRIEITDPDTGEVRTTRFDERRLQLIFDVNMRQSHAAGRWARIQRSRVDTHIVYRTMRDERVRASHRPWDDIVLPKDHPWWDTHFPPNGWRCRCTAFGINQRGIERLQQAGSKIKTEPPPTTWVEFANRSTGQAERVPRGIDPGFAYNPGQVHPADALDRLARGINATPEVPKGTGNAHSLARALINRGRGERAFREFLAAPPKGVDANMPVAAVPGLQAEPAVAAVRAADLLRQAARADYPQVLPTTPAAWAMAQAVIDRGQRLDLGEGRVLWWWLRGSGADERVHVLELQRTVLVWHVRQLAALSRDEARTQYPELARVLRDGGAA